MHKTGSSSIQEWLYFGPQHLAFHFVSLGHVNGSEVIETLFGDNPSEYWRRRGIHLSTEVVKRLRRNFGRRFRKALRQAYAGSQTPIISAERCWTLSEPSLGRLRDLLLEEGFEPRVIAYLRPIRSYAESHFVESFRSSRIASLDPASLGLGGSPGLSRWSGRLELLERVFGSHRLILRPFMRTMLVNGCAVQDFCHTIGLTSQNVPKIRTRVALSIDAVRMLWAHQRFLSAVAPRKLSDQAVLADLDGDRLYFHNELFAPLAGEIDFEERTVLSRYGLDLRERRRQPIGNSCIREEADLLRYRRSSLDWLAAKSRSKPITCCEGESAAREVATQVDRIRQFWAWRKRVASVRTRLTTKLYWIMRGD